MNHTLRLSIVATATLLFSTGSGAQQASRISTDSDGTIIAGKVVWADLVTTDVDAAESFYSEVFGWESRHGEDPGYVELMHDGKLIAAIARYDDDVTSADARWLISISVADVDATASEIEARGGEILETPEDFPDRGRFAVVADGQGAIFMLLRATGGDPAAAGYVVGALEWAELWTRDVVAAARFYEEALGYRALRGPGVAGKPSAVLTTMGAPRATIVNIPWDDVEPNWIPYIPVADARATLDRVTAAGGGVLVTSDEVEDDSGSFAAIVSDPVGGVFGIQEIGGGK